MCEVIAIRHGESEWNVEWRQQGHMDSPLTRLGVRQSEAVADVLAHQPFAALYSSDLGRAMHTAKIIGRKTGHEVLPEPRLRERHLGVFEGLTHREARARYPEDYELFRSGEADFKIPTGETKRQRYQRHVAVLEELAERHAAERIVLVAHGGLLDSLICRTLGLPLAAPRRYQLHNAALNSFFFQDGIWVLGTWGDLHHLTQLQNTGDSK